MLDVIKEWWYLHNLHEFEKKNARKLPDLQEGQSRSAWFRCETQFNPENFQCAFISNNIGELLHSLVRQEYIARVDALFAPNHILRGEHEHFFLTDNGRRFGKSWMNLLKRLHSDYWPALLALVSIGLACLTWTAKTLLSLT